MPKELAVGSTVYSCTLFKGINSEEFFHDPETCQHDLLYWLLCLELFFYWKSFTLWTVFLIQACSAKSIFSSFCEYFLTKTCFYIHIPYSSENFTWFALLSQKKFGDRPLFKPGIVYLICCHFESLKSNIFVELKKNLL